MRRKPQRAIQGSGTHTFKALPFLLVSWLLFGYSFAMTARELWERREYSFTFMPVPQQRKSHMKNGSSNAENVKEQDLNVVLVTFLCGLVPFTFLRL